MNDLKNNFEKCTAVYRNTGISEYDDNPLIKALPPLYDARQVASKLKQLPAFDIKEIELNSVLRTHMAYRLTYSFFQPLSQHLNLESKISLMIRKGYIARNPDNGLYYSQLQNGYERVITGDLNSFVFKGIETTAEGLSLFGCSGCGKSKTIERVLGMYPPVICHPKYNIVQLPYLKLECPSDGDLISLCIDFFEKVDMVLGTDYKISHGRKKMGVSGLVAGMCQIANFHALGILIIDEVQNLNEAKSGGAKKMHNFFVSLVNTIGVPIIQIGTHKARSFFQQTFRAARRITGMGSLLWDRLPKNEQWERFLKTLWKYQWLKDAKPLDKEISDLMYDRTQGVMDILINLFVLSQSRAIVTGKETISPGIISSVYEDEFKPVHPMLEALRKNDVKMIKNFDDLMMPNIQQTIVNTTNSLIREIQQKQSTKSKDSIFYSKAKLKGLDQDMATTLLNELRNLQPDISLEEAVSFLEKEPLVKEKQKPNKVSVKDWNKLDHDDLRYLFSKKKGSEFYQELLKNRIILDLNALVS